MIPQIIRRLFGGAVSITDPLSTPLFKERLAFLHESQWWSADKMAAYQFERLKNIIVHAYHRVPFYRNRYRALHLTPDDLTSLQDIKKFPTITKQTIQENHRDFIPEGVAADTLYQRSTGGSTGVPLTIMMDLDHRARDHANTEYYMNLAGLSIFSYRSARLYGDKIPENVAAKGEYWYIKDDRQLVLSCYHIMKETVREYVAKLNEFQPVYIHSRPSAIYPLCEQMARNDLRLKVSLKGLFLDGEMLPEGQRNLLEQVFGCPVFMIYGHTEGCVVGVTIPPSRDLHFLPQVGLLELLSPDGSEVSREGERGEMVVTGFSNFMFPLIRYRTFDIAIQTKRLCPGNRPYKTVEQVEGRIQDYAINKHHNAIPLAPAFFNYNDMDWKGIRQFQVVQEAVGKLILKIVREPETEESPAAMRGRILEKIGQILGNTFDLDLLYVEEIPRTRLGKFRYLDQKLDMQSLIRDR